MFHSIRKLFWSLGTCAVFAAGVSHATNTNLWSTSCVPDTVVMSNSWTYAQSFKSLAELDEMISQYEMQVRKREGEYDAYLSNLKMMSSEEFYSTTLSSKIVFSNQLERFTRERRLVELVLKDHLLTETKAGYDFIGSSLVMQSPEGLRLVSDLQEICTLLGEAGSLKIYGDIDPEKPYVFLGIEEKYKKDSITICSSDLIDQFARFMKESEFEIYQEPVDGYGAIGSVRHILIEIEDEVYFEINASDSIECKNGNIYVHKKSSLSEEADLIEEVLEILLEKKQNKQNQSIEAIATTPVD